jgi:hypothetical protein
MNATNSSSTSADEAMPIAEAMEQAQAVLDAEQPVDVVEEEATTQDGPCWCGLTHAPGVTHAQPEDEPQPVEASVPEQVPLFPPPPPPPFDFEKAYEELARLDQRARNKKRAWEACKRDTKEAREEYDEALEDVHTGFTKIDSARREWLRQQQLKQPVLVPVADAAPETTEGERKTEGGEEQTMSDLEQTIDDPQDPEENDAPDDDESDEETTTDAPGE